MFYNYLHSIQSSPPVITQEESQSDVSNVQDSTSDVQDNTSDALQSREVAAKPLHSGTRSRALHSIPSDYTGLTLTTELYVRNFTLFENPMLTATQVVDMIAHAWRNTLHYASEEDLPDSRQRPAQVDSYVCTIVLSPQISDAVSKLTDF